MQRAWQGTVVTIGRIADARPTPALTAGLLLIAALVVMSSVSAQWRRLSPPPSRLEAQELVRYLDGRVVAYEIWGGEPYLVFESRGRILLDHLWADPFSMRFPPTPQWQLSARWEEIAPTDRPASVGVVSCRSPDRDGHCAWTTLLFGEITEPEIVVMDVRYSGEWHSYPVAEPGYAIRVDGFSGVPAAYRWLDAAGEVLWSVR